MTPELKAFFEFLVNSPIMGIFIILISAFTTMVLFRGWPSIDLSDLGYGDHQGDDGSDLEDDEEDDEEDETPKQYRLTIKELKLNIDGKEIKVSAEINADLEEI